MMSATRRQFLSGAAAATAGVALLDTRTAAKSDELQPPRRPIDERVANGFFDWPRHQDTAETASPRLVGLLYGLLCTDFSGGEALLPNVADIEHVSEHVARLWVQTARVVDASQVPDAGKGFDGSKGSTYFDIAGYSVAFEQYDAGDRRLPEPSTPLRRRDSTRHPWLNIRWVRCLRKLTGLRLIPDSQRNDEKFVTARVRLMPGSVAAVPPFSPDGQHYEWRVRQSNNREVVSATTDSMLWSRRLRPETTKVKVVLTRLDKSRSMTIVLEPRNGTLLLAITYATFADHEDPTKLTDSKAFARLLRNGDPEKFPIPVLEGAQRVDPALSSEDVHCECASCP